MLSLIATISMLDSKYDAKTIAMIKHADDLIRAGHPREGSVAWFEAALRVVDPIKESQYDEHQDSRWSAIVQAALGSRYPKDADSVDGWVSPVTGYGNAMVLQLGYPGHPPAKDEVFAGAIACIWKTRGRWRASLISTWASRFPVVDGPAYRMGNWLVAAGPGNNGENRDHAVLRLWRRNVTAWTEVQALQSKWLTNDSHFLKRRDSPDPRIFIARSRVYTPLNEGWHPGLPHRILREEWRFNGHRFVILPGQFENTAFLSLERFLLAMRMGNLHKARRYSDESHLEQLKKLGASSWNWPVRISGIDEGTVFDLAYKGDYDLPPCRVTMKRAGDHWRIASVDPHYKPMLVNTAAP